MRTPLSWFVLLLVVCVVGPYVTGARPRHRRDWILLVITISFLAWLLAGLTSVRA